MTPLQGRRAFLLGLAGLTAVAAPLVAALTGPVAQWMLDESGGAVAADVGGRFDGVWVNGPTPATGVQGGALAFDGGDDYVRIPRDPALEPAAFTIALWVRLSGLDYAAGTGRLHGLAGKGRVDTLDAATHAGWWFAYDNRSNRKNFAYTAFGNTAGGWAGGGNNFSGAGYEYVFQNDRFYHLAITVDGRQACLYVDGVRLGLPKALTNLRTADATQDLILGGVRPKYNPLQGALDDVRFYDRALADAEIAALAAGLPPPAVVLTSPLPFATVSGVVPLQGDAAGDGPVRFERDGAPLAGHFWDTTGVANGRHRLRALAVVNGADAASGPVEVIVYNPPNGDPTGGPRGLAPDKFIPTFAIVYGLSNPALNSMEGLSKFDILVSDPRLSARLGVAGTSAWNQLKARNPRQHIALYGLGAGEYSLAHDVTAADGWDWIRAHHGPDAADPWTARGRATGRPLQGDAYPNERLMELGNPNWRRYWMENFYRLAFGSGRLYDTGGADGAFFDNTAFKVIWKDGWGAEGLDQTPAPGCSDGFVLSSPLNASAPRCVYRDEPTTYFQNGLWLDDLWKIDQQALLRESIPYFRDRGLRTTINFGDLDTALDRWLDLNRLPTPPFAAMEEGGFVNPWGGDGVSFKAASHWADRVQNLWTLRGTKSIVLMVNHGNPPPSGTPGQEWMDQPDPQGTTGWQALWFALGSFLLSFDDVNRNAALGFTAWRYRGAAYFDEFDPAHLHLGRARGPYVVWPDGLYAREFDDGWVVVNPAGHAAVTGRAMPFAQGYVIDHPRLKTSPPLASTFDLAPMRSIILLRESRSIGNDDNPATRPHPPRGLRHTP